MCNISSLLKSPHCGDRKVTFENMIGVVSDLKKEGDSAYSFRIGTMHQVVQVQNAKIPDWLKNGIRIEIYFNTKTIASVN